MKTPEDFLLDLIDAAVNYGASEEYGCNDTIQEYYRLSVAASHTLTLLLGRETTVQEDESLEKRLRSLLALSDD